MKIKQQQNFEKKTYRHTHQKQQQIYKKLANDKHSKKDSLKKDKICTKDTKFYYAYI